MDERQVLELSRLRGWVNQDQYEECLRDPRAKPVTALIEKGWITPDQAKELRKASTLHLYCGTCREGFPEPEAPDYRRPHCKKTLVQVRAGELPTADTSLPDDAQAAAQNPENVFGRFVRISQLGVGGSGTVWKCYDWELGRYVAVKFLQGVGDVIVRRFVREANIAARLDHPNIARIYDVGSRQNEHFIVMQYIEGETVTSKSAPLNHLLRLVAQAARAIHYAHEQGVIHRDLKPENLMVARDGRVYVLDFGLARELSAEPGLSVSGTVMGTPAFMSPEQARGELSRLDVRSDVYSLGATLYELATGQAPFEAESVTILLQEVQHEDPRLPRAVRRDLPADVETIILKAMEKEPQRRYAGAKDFAEDLERYLSDEPIRARRASVLYRLRKKLSKHRWVSVSVAAAALLGITLGLYVLFANAQFGRLEQRALDLQAATELYKTAERDLYLLRMRSYRPAWRLSEQEFREYERVIERCRAQMQNTGESADGWWVVGRSRQVLGDWEGAIEAYDAGLRREPKHPMCSLYKGKLVTERLALKHAPHLKCAAPAVPPEAALALLRVEGVEPIERDLAEAYERLLYEKPLQEYCEQMAEKWAGKDFSEEFLLVCAMYHKDQVEKYAREALKVRPGLYEAYFWIGVRCDDVRDDKGAVEAFTSAVRIHPRLAEAYAMRGRCRGRMKDFAGGIEDCTKAFEINPRYAGALSLRGDIRRLSKNLRGAMEDYDRAIQIDPLFAEGYTNRGATWVRRGNLDRALQDYARAIELDPNDEEPYMNRAAILFEGRDFAGALRDYNRVVEIMPWNEDAYLYRAAVHQAMGELAAAVEDYTLAIKHNPKNPDTYLDHAMFRLKLGDRSGAMEDARKAIEVGGAEWKRRNEAANMLR